uniref:Secreted protein n=1 Tax=Poecilia mexicana TaxID=48701 RepID=A0A3B3XIF2_9TELE
QKCLLVTLLCVVLKEHSLIYVNSQVGITKCWSVTWKRRRGVIQTRNCNYFSFGRCCQSKMAETFKNHSRINCKELFHLKIFLIMRNPQKKKMCV